MKKDSKKTFLAFTDASAFNNGKKEPNKPEHSCSAGVINLNSNIVYSFIHYNPNSSISYGEMYAIYCLLADFVPLIENTKHKLILFTDSDYACKSINVWSKNWIKKSKGGVWYGSAGGPVAYQRLIEAILELKSRAKVSINRVSGGHIDIYKKHYELEKSYKKCFDTCRKRSIRDNNLKLTTEQAHYCIFYNNICDQMAKAGLTEGMRIGEKRNERKRKSFEKFIT